MIALCDQWAHAISDAVFRFCGTGIGFPRLAAPVLGLSVDKAATAAAALRLPGCLVKLDQPLAGASFLVGYTVTSTGLLLLPMMQCVAMTPEGAGALPCFLNLQIWHRRMASRAGVLLTAPPSFETLREVD